MTVDTITIEELRRRVRAEITRRGLRPLAREIGVDHAHLHHAAVGEQPPGPQLRRWLGVTLREVYVRVDGDGRVDGKGERR